MLKLDILVRKEHLEDDLREIIRYVHPEWVDNFGDELKTTPLSGGISNTLYACFPKSKGLNSNDTLLFRLYGKDTEKLIDRSKEIAAMSMINAIGLGPKFYCEFVNGCCYEYMCGVICDTKLVSDPAVYTKIAEATATLHLANFKGLRSEDELDETDERPFIFDKIKQILDLVSADYAKNMSHMTEAYLKKTPSLTQLKEEFCSLEAQMRKYICFI